MKRLASEYEATTKMSELKTDVAEVHYPAARILLAISANALKVNVAKPCTPSVQVSKTVSQIC
jgi:hypothetical protein